MAKNIFDSAGDLFDVDTIRDKFFVDTLNDLFHKVNDPTDYNIIRASGLIRQLLKDSSEQPLVHKVGRKHRFKLKFNVNLEYLIESKYKELQHTLVKYNPLSNAKSTEGVSLDKFLKLKCIYIKDESNDLNLILNIGDIIDILANSHGGVHHGNTENNKIIPKKEIKDFQRFDVLFGSVGIYEANYDSDLFKVAHNCYMVILNALRPLLLLVQFDLKRTKAVGHTVSKTFQVITKIESEQKTNEDN